jgi:predicted dehydrogenase
MNNKLKFGILGCGFWARYQLPAWLELEGVVPVALYNRTIGKAEALARQYNISHCYNDAEQLFKNEDLDFVDIITDVDTHAPFVEMAAAYGVPVICQKPIAPSLEIARSMVNTCAKNNIPFYIHENFRWQAPLRRLKELLESMVIGKPFKANVRFCNSFPVFQNQPFLASLDHFILTDVGSHVLDICRFLFGEASSLYCQAATINAGIRGEDVASVSLKMESGLHCYAEMSFASILENEAFPQTFVSVEGISGSIELTRDYEIRITTREGTLREVAAPVFYDWMDPAYAVVHSSIVDCNRNILQALLGGPQAETTGTDNYETAKLVWASYASIASNEVIDMKKFGDTYALNALSTSGISTAL